MRIARCLSGSFLAFVLAAAGCEADDVDVAVVELVSTTSRTSLARGWVKTLRLGTQLQPRTPQRLQPCPHAGDRHDRIRRGDATAAAATTGASADGSAGSAGSAGYAPSTGLPCPSPRPTIRSARSLSQNETDWLRLRAANTRPALVDFLRRVNITGFDVDAYFGDGGDGGGAREPVVGIAVSGGGYRALMTGAGALAAFDNRTANSTAPGQLGGLLQASTYLSGLSGGSWLVGSLYMHGFPPVQNIVAGTQAGLGSLWQFNYSILQGPSTLSLTDYYSTLVDEVKSKEDAGFNTSITDYWGRALSFQLFNSSTGAPDFTFSSIAGNSAFSAGDLPMPIIVADERAPNETLVPANTTVFDIDPWEIGSWDPTLSAFAPLAFVGSTFDSGSVPKGESCTLGFDNIGFVVGTSSSLFNQFYLQLNNTGAPAILKNAIGKFLAQWGARNGDISLWLPNPFFGYNNDTNRNAQSDVLTLVDGGEDLQNIPFQPLLRPSRNVDVIFAIDSSADTSTLWPNGTAMVATFNRSRSALGNTTLFPEVPDQNTFINLGMNGRPTFFGCGGNGNQSASGPLVVYLPNAPVSYHSNVSTFDLSYSQSERDSIIRNGFNMANRANGSLDAEWPACVGCAILARSLARTNTVPPPLCTACYDRYCWNGTANATTPPTYEPTLAVKSAASRPLHSAWALLASMTLWFLLFVSY